MKAVIDIFFYALQFHFILTLNLTLNKMQCTSSCLSRKTLKQLNDFVRFGSILGVSVMGRGGLVACY